MYGAGGYLYLLRFICLFPRSEYAKISCQTFIEFQGRQGERLMESVFDWIPGVFRENKNERSECVFFYVFFPPPLPPTLLIAPERQRIIF